jgi:hypothetical protein
MASRYDAFESSADANEGAGQFLFADRQPVSRDRDATAQGPTREERLAAQRCMIGPGNDVEYGGRGQVSDGAEGRTGCRSVVLRRVVHGGATSDYPSLGQPNHLFRPMSIKLSGFLREKARLWRLDPPRLVARYGRDNLVIVHGAAVCWGTLEAATRRQMTWGSTKCAEHSPACNPASNSN